MNYLSKKDLAGSITGLEHYKPGDDSTKELALNTTSGTTLGEPTMVVFKHHVYPELIENYFKPLGKRHLRPTAQHSICLNSVNYSLRHSPMQFFMILDNRHLKHEVLAQLIADFKPTSIRATCSHVSALIDTLRTRGKEAVLKTVKTLSVCGEMVGKRFREKFDKVMKGVRYISCYGLAETEIFNYYDPELEKHYPDFPLLTFCCFSKEHHIDIYEPDSSGFGEIVITSPDLERYRTGDRGKIVAPPKGSSCTQVLLLEGRQNYDIVHCAGATVLLDEIERVFQLLRDDVQDFLVEVREFEDGAATKGYITFKVVLTQKGNTDPDTLDRIERTASEHLRLTPTRTLGDLIRDEIFLAPIVSVVEKIPATHKTIRLRKVEQSDS